MFRSISQAALNAVAMVSVTGLLLSPASAQAAVCATGYIRYVDFDARPWKYFPQITVAVDQTGFGTRQGVTTVHTGYGPAGTANILQRWDRYLGAVQAAFFARLPVRIDSNKGCGDPNLEDLTITVCKVESDCDA